MRYLCFLPWLWVGCTPSSILTLTVNVSGDALAQVEDFPVQVQVDFANDERILSLEICEFAGGDFLEATLDPETYQGCRGATTVRAVLVPLDRACDQGHIGRIDDALLPDDTWYGYGERVVFDSDACGVEQATVLAIDPY